MGMGNGPEFLSTCKGGAGLSVQHSGKQVGFHTPIGGESQDSGWWKSSRMFVYKVRGRGVVDCVIFSAPCTRCRCH